MAKLLEIENSIDQLKQRIAKYYDVFFIDEVQDFGGNDFNFLKNISDAQLNIFLVGDFFQHTYDTSRDGVVNKNLYNDFAIYKDIFTSVGFKVDLTTLIKSYRCTPTVCNFITESLAIKIESHREEKSEIRLVIEFDEIERIMLNHNIIKLFIKEHYKYKCFSKNWGECKGEDDYHDVCIIVNKKTYDLFKKERLVELPQTTKNKLYVACTRSKNNIYFIPDQLITKYKLT